MQSWSEVWYICYCQVSKSAKQYPKSTKFGQIIVDKLISLRPLVSGHTYISSPRSCGPNFLVFCPELVGRRCRIQLLPAQGEAFWKLFKEAMRQKITFEVPHFGAQNAKECCLKEPTPALYIIVDWFCDTVWTLDPPNPHQNPGLSSPFPAYLVRPLYFYLVMKQRRHSEALAAAYRSHQQHALQSPLNRFPWFSNDSLKLKKYYFNIFQHRWSTDLYAFSFTVL